MSVDNTVDSVVADKKLKKKILFQLSIDKHATLLLIMLSTNIVHQT